jgi:hypothetical protein
MTLLRGTATLACCLSAAVLTIPSARAEMHQTYASGQWTAFTGTNADNQPVCGIATSGAEGRRIAISQESGETGLHLALEKASWNIPDGTTVDLTIQIDRNAAIPFSGQGSHNRVTVDIPFEQSIPLMRQLRAGTVMHVFFPSGNEAMWTGGLTGTSNVINAFNDCRGSLIPAAAPGAATQPFTAPAGQPAPAATQPFTPPAPAAPTDTPQPKAPPPHS